MLSFDPNVDCVYDRIATVSNMDCSGEGRTSSLIHKATFILNTDNHHEMTPTRTEN